MHPGFTYAGISAVFRFFKSSTAAVVTIAVLPNTIAAQ